MKQEEYIYETDSSFRKQLVEAIIKEHVNCSKASKALMYTRHQNFLDFEEFYPKENKLQPIYMSFVRHPVERIISWYYYVRNSAYQIDETGKAIKTKMMPIAHLKVVLKICKN